jgi:hypothetical protein
VLPIGFCWKGNQIVVCTAVTAPKLKALSSCRAHRLASALADVLDDKGWYVDFRSRDETFVVFVGRVFRYRRGDEGGRAEAEAHARRCGVPDAQLDWPE